MFASDQKNRDLDDSHSSVIKYPQDEIYRLFIEEKLIKEEKGWEKYESRQPGCMKALCRAAEVAFFKSFGDKELNLEIIKDIHKSVTTNVTNLNTTNHTPGEFRKYTAGFENRIFDAKNRFVYTLDYWKCLFALIRKQKKLNYDSKENLDSLRAEYNYILKNPSSPEELEMAKNTLKLLENKTGEGWVGSGLAIGGEWQYNDTFYNTSNIDRSIDDLQFFPSASNDNVAHESIIYAYRAPTPGIVTFELNSTINNYNINIKKSSKPDEKLTVISQTIWEINHTHPFRDANTRTLYLLLNRLLLQNGFPLCTLENPNEFEFYSPMEMVKKIKTGIENTKTIIDKKVDAEGNLLGFSTKSIPEKSQNQFREWSKGIQLLANTPKKDWDSVLVSIQKRLILIDLDIIKEKDWKIEINEDINLNFEDEKGETAISKASASGSLSVVKDLIRYGVKESINKANPVTGDTPLLLAVRNNHAHIVEFLLTNGADGNFIHSKTQQTALLLAIEKGYTKVANILINHTKDSIAKQVSNNVMDPLVLAVKKGNVDIVRLLIASGYKSANESEDLLHLAVSSDTEAGIFTESMVLALLDMKDIPLNKTNKDNQTPLDVIYPKNQKIAELLKAKGAKGKTPKNLYYAALTGDNDLVKQCLKNGSSVNEKEPSNQKTALHLACSAKESEIISTLLAVDGIEINAVDKEGKTALHYAAENGDLDTVKTLISSGADPSLVDKNGKTAEAIAEQRRFFLISNTIAVKTKIEQAKRDAKVDLDQENEYGETLLSLTAREGILENVKSLIQCGKSIDLNKVNPKNGNTPIMLAAKYGHAGVVEFLIKSGAKFDEKDSQLGQTPLYIAAYNRKSDVIKVLLDHKAQVNQVEKYDTWTPLHAACYANDIASVKALLEAKDINIDQPDKAGITPLHVIIKYRRDPEIAKLLIQKGADCNFPASNGNAPLNLAITMNNTVMIEILSTKKKVENTDSVSSHNLFHTKNIPGSDTGSASHASIQGKGRVK